MVHSVHRQILEVHAVRIGTIVKSNSHISYLCRVYGPLEADTVPGPSDYAFGTFVSLSPSEQSGIRLVGIIKDTLLLNPEFGNVGPRLSTDLDLSVFSPDYLNERGVLVDVLVLGWREGGRAHHEVPSLAAQVGTCVDVMTPEDVCAFHRDVRGRFLIGYLPHLMTGSDPMLASLLYMALERLEPYFPEQRRVVRVLMNNVAWKARVVPAG